MDLPIPESKDIPSKIVDFVKGLGGFGDAASGANALGQVGGILGAGSPIAISRMRKAVLPMDEASRAARAAEMGFNMDVYHGTSPKYVGHGINSEKGVTTISTGGKLREFDYIRPFGDAGIHVDPDPDVASVAAGMSRTTSSPLGGKRGASILPLKAKVHNPLEIADVNIWKDPHSWIFKLEKDPRLKADSPEGRVLQELLAKAKEAKASGTYRPGDWVNVQNEWAHTFRDVLKNHGYDSVKYANRSEGTGGPSYLLLDPDQLRLKWAAFDPAKAKSGDLLASLAALIGGGGAIASQEDR